MKINTLLKTKQNKTNQEAKLIGLLAIPKRGGRGKDWEKQRNRKNIKMNFLKMKRRRKCYIKNKL